MNIDPQKAASLFYFAHQDDECGVFQLIEDELSSGAQVHCFYYTSGTFSGLPSAGRNQESINILLKLGVDRDKIHFVGADYKIADCKLVDHLNFVFDDSYNFLNKIKVPCKIYVPAFEGGHPDHDALHVAVALAAKKNCILENAFQYALYNGDRCFGPMFRVLSPLRKNGNVFRSKISLKNRFRYLKFCLSYPSQLKSWIGLFPFFLLHYLLNGHQMWQSISLKRLSERQHSGELYFARRRFCDEEYFRDKVSAFLGG